MCLQEAFFSSVLSLKVYWSLCTCVRYVIFQNNYLIVVQNSTLVWKNWWLITLFLYDIYFRIFRFVFFHESRSQNSKRSFFFFLVSLCCRDIKPLNLQGLIQHVLVWRLFILTIYVKQCDKCVSNKILTAEWCIDHSCDLELSINNAIT